MTPLMKLKTGNLAQHLAELFLILVIAALAYLPNITKASIFRDDWYYALDRTIGGPGAFQEMFSIDRPARGPLFEAYYQLFDIQPLPYHISSFVWRLLGGFAALYLFNLIWPTKKRAALFMALLFLLFPGYSRWLEGFENQPRILSSVLEAFSIALTLQALRSQKSINKILAWVGSIITGWAYIALVDFAFGMEFFRLLCVVVYIGQQSPDLSLIKKIYSGIRAWALALIIPLGFLYWRIFIFHNQRPTTDIGLQLSYLADSPLHTGLVWLIRLFQSTLNVSVLAWVFPSSQTLFNFKVSTIFIGFFIGLVTVAAILFTNYFLAKFKNDDEETKDPANWKLEAIIIGLIGVAAGVTPVVMANRFATLGNYSHYALPASLAGAVFIGAIVFSIQSPRIRLGVITILIMLGVLNQYVVSNRIIQEETIISNFWKQLVWRAPGIQAGTTLFVNYPSVDYGQDIDAVDGPANYLYYPGRTNQLPALYPLAALEQGEPSSKDILSDSHKAYTFKYRTHISEINYSNLLVITQPFEEACVHVLDSNSPRLSKNDPLFINAVAQYSKIQRIQANATAPVPNRQIFGSELSQGWCYHYEKADLALQIGDWQQIVALGNDAFNKNLEPNDKIEWMPFIQAYAYTGDVTALSKIAKNLKQEPRYQALACQILRNMNSGPYNLSALVVGEVDRLFCSN